MRTRTSYNKPTSRTYRYTSASKYRLSAYRSRRYPLVWGPSYETHPLGIWQICGFPYVPKIRNNKAHDSSPTKIIDKNLNLALLRYDRIQPACSLCPHPSAFRLYFPVHSIALTLRYRKVRLAGVKLSTSPEAKTIQSTRRYWQHREQFTSRTGKHDFHPLGHIKDNVKTALQRPAGR